MRRKNLHQSDEEEEEESEDAAKDGQASIPLLLALTKMDTIQIIENWIFLKLPWNPDLINLRRW